MSFNINRVIAPMVGQSDAPYRSLCLKYGSNCVYSEMLYSQLIIEDNFYLDSYLPSIDHQLQQYGYPTHPLVVQICGNNPHILAEAVKRIAITGRADAIDFNLGCPQERAKDGLFGSYLLDKCHWSNVFACVKAMIDSLREYNIPLFCKIRLIQGSNILELTKTFCFGLYDCGVRVFCIHGRTRGSTKYRRVGPADLQIIAQIASSLQIYHESKRLINSKSQSIWDQKVIIISNGNITSPQDIYQNYNILSEIFKQSLQQSIYLISNPIQESNKNISLIDSSILLQLETISTHSWLENGFGMMSAEGILKDPALFQRYLNDYESNQSQTNLEIPSLYHLFEEYCQLSQIYSSLGGWNGFDEFERIKRMNRLNLENIDKESSLEFEESIKLNIESKQITIAKQHLNWMLGKSGHGRLIRYEYKSEKYHKHTEQMNALKEANSLEELLNIAQGALPNI